MEEDFINLQLKAEADTKEREWGERVSRGGGHLPLGDAPISNSAA